MLLDSLSAQLSRATEIITGTAISRMLPISSIRETFDQLGTTIHIGLTAVALLFLLLGCLTGYKLARFFMAVTGFAIGMIVGYIVAAKIIGLSGITVPLATVAGGILIAAMAYWVYRAGIFLLCFVFAFTSAATVLPFTNDIQFFLCTLVGFAVGALSQKYIRPVIIMTSAVVCGMLGGSTAIKLAALLDLGLPTSKGVTILAGIVLSVFGIIIQFLTTKEPLKKAKKTKKAPPKMQQHGGY